MHVRISRPQPCWLGEPDHGGWYTEAEQEAASEAIRDGSDWRSHFDARHREAFEAAFAEYVGARHAVAVNSGGCAVDLAVAALDAEPGDEVISCAVNFPGTHLAVLGQCLRLRLCEPDPTTLNLDAARIEPLLTSRTKAVLVTHMNGLPADMDAIRAVVAGAARPIRVIVDAARACGAREPAGTVGGRDWLTVFSFQRKKAMTTLGEGGMLTTCCDSTAARLRRMRAFGHGEDWGSSHKLTETQAAVGLVQLRRLDQMNAARRVLARERSGLLAHSPDIRVPADPAGYEPLFLPYTLLLDERFGAPARDRLASRLRRDHGIGCAIANPPTWRANRLIRASVADQGPFPIAESIGDRVLCPSIHPLMSTSDNLYVAQSVLSELATLEPAG